MYFLMFLVQHHLTNEGMTNRLLSTLKPRKFVDRLLSISLDRTILEKCGSNSLTAFPKSKMMGIH